MLPLFAEANDCKQWGKLLQRVEDFKAVRNAFAHGLDISDDDKASITVETVNRAGKPRQVTVTPESHRKLLADAHTLLTELNTACKNALRSPLRSGKS